MVLTQVWNEELVRAFTARLQYAIAHGTRHFKYENAINKIKAVRGDIYTQNRKEGGVKIVNMPKDLPADTLLLINSIVTGDAPVIPPGHEDYDNEIFQSSERRLSRYC